MECSSSVLNVWRDKFDLDTSCDNLTLFINNSVYTEYLIYFQTVHVNSKYVCLCL